MKTQKQEWALKVQMSDPKKREREDALRKTKERRKEFGFTAGMPKDSLRKARDKGA